MTRQMTKTITVTHTYTANEVREWRRIEQTRAELDAAEDELKKTVKADQIAQMAAKLAGYGKPPEVELRYNDAVLKFSIVERIVEDEKPKPSEPKPPQRPPQVYVEPKLINALLHGKLLTDAEKRKLVARVIPDDVLEDGVNRDPTN